MSQKNKKYTLGGGYRKVLQVPKDLTWKIINYNQIHDNLILGDMEELRGQESLKNDPDGKYKALIIEMSLKSSAYATMALREILSHDTSSQSQAQLSAAYHAKDAEKTKEKKINDEKINNGNVNNDVAIVKEEKNESCVIEENLNKDKLDNEEEKMDESCDVKENLNKNKLDNEEEKMDESCNVKENLNEDKLDDVKEKMDESAEPAVESTDEK